LEVRGGASVIEDKARSLPDAKTIVQQTTRMKMKLTIEFLKACIPVVRIGFLGYSTPRRPLSMRLLRTTTTMGSKEHFRTWRLITARSWLARGDLPAAEQAMCEPAGEGRIRFTWSATSERPGARHDDTAMLLAYNPSKKVAVYSLQGSIRAMEKQF
jgi:hypothetical protein